MTTGLPPEGAGVAPRLDSLQAGRAMAALLVALFHARLVVQEQMPDAGGVWEGFAMGHAGVEYFFVLSGFLMVLIHARDFGRPERAGSFAAKRFQRVYPVFWIVLAGLVLSQLAIGRLDERAARPALLAADILLLPTGAFPVLTAAWTLSHEILFYGLFGVALLWLRFGFLMIGLWMAATVLAGIAELGGTRLAHPWSFLLSPYNLLFGMGMAAAGLFRRAGRLLAVVMALSGLCLFVVAGMADVAGTPLPLPGRTVLAYGMGATLIVAGLARLDQLCMLRFPRLLVFLGDASYSIYLVHAPLMTFMALLLVNAGLAPKLGVAPVFALLVAGGVVVGAIFHMVVERPLLRWLAGRRRPPAGGAMLGAAA